MEMQKTFGVFFFSGVKLESLFEFVSIWLLSEKTRKKLTNAKLKVDWVFDVSKKCWLVDCNRKCYYEWEKKKSIKLEDKRGEGNALNMKFWYRFWRRGDLFNAQKLNIESEGGVWWNNSGVTYKNTKTV